eukprot:m.7475 g.7475  ORF g.7475 m.7475 type:complete len:322 (-) comp5227_c0_seq1:56-1021(-)
MQQEAAEHELIEAAFIVDGASYLHSPKRDAGRPEMNPQFLIDVAEALGDFFDKHITQLHFFDAVIKPEFFDFPLLRNVDQERRAFHHKLSTLQLKLPRWPEGKQKPKTEVSVHLRHVQPEYTHCPSPECEYHRDKSIIKPVQCGVDSDMSTFALARLDKRIKHIFFWLRDGDLAPALRALTGKWGLSITIVSATEASLSLGLRNVVTSEETFSLEKLQKYYPTIRRDVWGSATEQDKRLEEMLRTLPVDQKDQLLSSLKDLPQEAAIFCFQESQKLTSGSALTPLDLQVLCQEYPLASVKQALKEVPDPTFMTAVAFIESL